MKNEKQKYNINNIFYAVVGVATLMMAIIGATFAYYTATESNDDVIKGNMATIGFDVKVTKMLKQDETRGGLIPMSNNMVHQALTANSGNSGNKEGICVDDNGNAVCQVYKITVINQSTTSMFVDGYVTLTNGSGTPVDYDATTTNKTTMRWAQAFCSTESGGVVTSCTTAGNSTVRPDTGSVAIAQLGSENANLATDPFNVGDIKTTRSSIVLPQANGPEIKTNKYEVINRNFIRVSDHVYGNTFYSRANDTTSALVYNQYLDAKDANTANNDGTSSSTFTDAQVYYIVVWLTENGQNQTTGATGASQTGDNFFRGSTTFITAEGNEVTATFTGATRITPDTPKTQ